ncbi:3-oxoadipate enol-lactonase [Amycolatopsis sp. 195334CR]|uniref:3-oxoadipate enol-lactonase n=1 Tax=Amycolatopsis sp. 195334CR TaxID=2814588 RepID=UPI001A9057A2|nr:3-oxoadipate enol-lactonase [Amycolatopsis sp. 195334CR]MBN6033565.1 3-oxoadipate enol-lactonase [Amycolatopsis sp. 195334CR]
MPVHYVVDGPEDGVPVVLSGSLGSALAMWEPQVRPLTEAGYRVIRYDHRGHGGSPVPDGPYDLADLGGDVLALLDRLGVGKAHFAGLSLGGMTGMWLGAHAPERLLSLVLCCTSAKLGPPEMWADRIRAVREGGTGSLASAVVGRWVTPAFDAGRRAELEEMVASTSDEGYAGCCAAIEVMNLTGELAQIPVPTLVISTSEDAATPPPHGKAIAEAIPGARFAEVGGAAHLGNVERPDEFSDLILARLAAR